MSTTKKIIAIILAFCFMLSNSILIYAKNTDDNSTEIYVRQIIEKYNIDDIRTLYMARNVKGYTEQITIKEKEKISDFLKELYNLKLTTNNDEGNIKIDLWRDAALGTVTIYSSTKGLSNQDISYYIDSQDVDRIIEKMNLHWVENNAGAGQPINGLLQMIKEYNEENISAIYLFRQGNENPEYAVLNNENRNEFLDKLAALVLYDSNDGTYGKIEFEINNSLPRKTFYVSNAGFTQTDGNKILKYLNWNDVENILQYMNIEWKNLSGVDLNGTTPRISLPNKSDKEELSKTYEIGILNQNGIIVGDPDGDLREGDEITRAEFAAVLCRAMGCENETENDDLKQKIYFPDVPAEHWAAGYVNFAYENGAISGFPDGVSHS